MKTQLVQTARKVLPVFPALLLCSACSTTGTAVGRLEEPSGAKASAVTFVWKSDAGNPDRGTISGTLPDGSHYSGRYFEVIKTADADIYSYAWEGWRPYWAGWRPGWRRPVFAGDMDWPGFVSIYTGRVIANMKSDDAATRLRCRFRADDARAGLDRGAHGECQLSNGESIQNVVVAPS